MANTGNVFPGTGENVDRGGLTDWTSPGNIVSDNTTDATVVGGASGSDYLVARNFNFASVPTNATIDGITVRVEASEHTSGTESLNAQIQDASATLVGSSKANTISGTTKAVYTYGTTSDTWSASPTAAMVHDADFGVRCWFTTAHDIRIDFVTMALEYTVPGPGIATETDTALALAITKIVAAGVATETDTALAPLVENQGGTQEIQTGLATETDAALALAATKIAVAGFAPETDVAITLAVRKLLAAGMSQETDAAFSTFSATQQVATGMAAETDAGLVLAAVKLVAHGFSSEADASLALGIVKHVSSGVAVETDLALALAIGNGGGPETPPPVRCTRNSSRTFRERRRL